MVAKVLAYYVYLIHFCGYRLSRKLQAATLKWGEMLHLVAAKYTFQNIGLFLCKLQIKLLYQDTSSYKIYKPFTCDSRCIPNLYTSINSFTSMTAMMLSLQLSVHLGITIKVTKHIITGMIILFCCCS